MYYIPYLKKYTRFKWLARFYKWGGYRVYRREGLYWNPFVK